MRAAYPKTNLDARYRLAYRCPMSTTPPTDPSTPPPQRPLREPAEVNRQRLRDSLAGLIAALADYDVWRSDPTVVAAFAEAHEALEADRRHAHGGTVGGGGVYMRDIKPNEHEAVVATMNSGFGPDASRGWVLVSTSRLDGAYVPDVRVEQYGRCDDFRAIHDLTVIAQGSDQASVERQALVVLGRMRCHTPGVQDSADPEASPARDVCGDAKKLALFVGVDPGNKGACAVIAVADCPQDDATHGQVLAVSVFDLPIRARDDGGFELDVPSFIAEWQQAIRRSDLNCVSTIRGLVEYPDDRCGSFRGSASSFRRQGVNAGEVMGALRSTGLVKADWVSSATWRGELGGEKGKEEAEALAVLAGLPLSPMQDCHAVGTTDRCVAVLLADLARRRWLGTALTPKSRGTAKAAKARKADRRKEAVARAVAPLTVAKARANATAEVWCPAGHEEGVDVPPLAVCSPRSRCCEARLLDWAWRQRPDLPGPPAKGTLVRQAILCMYGVTAYTRKTATAKRYTEVWGDPQQRDDHHLPVETFDVLEMHGLVRLLPGVKDVRYAPTERGLAWEKRLRESAAAEGKAGDDVRR